MDTGWLEDFVTLAEEGNFSRAAQTRNLSQPAFSRRIKALEDWVGAALVLRDTHRIALSAAGETFYGAAQDMLRRLATARNEAREIDVTAAGAVRFASTLALSLTFFPQWLRSFDDRRESGALSLVADNMVDCERLMLDGRVDLLLCHDHPAAAHRLDPANFRSIELGQDLLVPLSPADAAGAPRFPLPGTKDQPLPFLEFDERSGMGRILDASNRIVEHGAALRTTFQSHLASVLLAMARDGMGIAWLPLTLAQVDIDEGRLIRAGGPEWDVPIAIRLYRPRSRRNRAVEAFWTLAADAAAGTAQSPPRIN